MGSNPTASFMRDELMVKNGTYGFSDLPQTVRKFIIENATKIAGWTSSIEKGDGSNMMMEWTTFALTVEDWIKSSENNGVSLTDEMKGQIINHGKSAH